MLCENRTDVRYFAPPKSVILPQFDLSRRAVQIEDGFASASHHVNVSWLMVVGINHNA